MTTTGRSTLQDPHRLTMLTHLPRYRTIGPGAGDRQAVESRPNSEESQFEVVHDIAASAYRVEPIASIADAVVAAASTSSLADSTLGVDEAVNDLAQPIQIGLANANESTDEVILRARMAAFASDDVDAIAYCSHSPPSSYTLD